MQKTLEIVIVAGGTGGHVIPGLAIAELLRQQGVLVRWIGAVQGIENRLVPQAGLALEHIKIAGLRGKNILTYVKFPFGLIRAVLQSCRSLKRTRPAAVLAMGGYVSGPVGLAARLCNIPLFLHEQNSIAGMTNRWLAPSARIIFSGFPNSLSRFPQWQFIGNPLRAAIISNLNSSPAKDQQESTTNNSCEKLNRKLRILVIGGSLGAQALNQCLPKALASFAEQERPEVWHQSGANHIEQCRTFYQEQNIAPYRLDSFIDDMAAAYTWADVVVSRAGALTVSELAAAAKPSILVPFPHAVDDHQTANAQYLVNVGAALLLPQSQLDAQSLAKALQNLFDSQRLQRMSNAARAALPHDAGPKMVTAILDSLKFND
ncbi:MAG: undecaprenyldiphospho-muramoylpentapeptide beta-N-acetylglucosaminyltransferase [Pseudomonadota bacterium]